MKKEPLILRENALGKRILGIFFCLGGLSLLSIGLLFDLAGIFGYSDLLSRIIMTIVAAIIGLVFCFGSYFVITLKDKEMIFDAESQKLFYAEKNFFSSRNSVHSFSEIVNFGQEHTSLENSDFYDNYLHLANATGLEIPSTHKTDKDLQNRQIQEIKDFILFKK